MPFPFRRRDSAISSRAAFSQIYATNRRPIFRYIYGLTGGPPTLVEDLLAETFLRGWKARHRFEGKADAATGWLIRIAKRLVLDDYRRERVRMAHTGQPDETCADSMPEANALAAEQRRLLIELLNGLPPEPCEIVTLRYMLGWRVNEIATHMEMTEDNVSVTLHRALAKLRKDWADRQTE